MDQLNNETFKGKIGKILIEYVIGEMCKGMIVIPTADEQVEAAFENSAEANTDDNDINFPLLHTAKVEE